MIGDRYSHLGGSIIAVIFTNENLFMKRKLFYILTSGAFAVILACSIPFNLQGEGTADSQPPVETLVAEVRAQQITMAENQTKIDAKLTEIAEELRVARIFISRGGKAE